MRKPFQGIKIDPHNTPRIKRRYSVTSDIVAFRRCARQYGAFSVHKFAPAYQTQIYFGTILHQVLDRCHTYYHGISDPTTKGNIPDNGQIISDNDIIAYFNDLRNAKKTNSPQPAAPSTIIRFFSEVEDGLKSRGIYAITQDMRLKVVRLLQYFNALEGPTLYPRVKDTEHRLQADQQTHILHGVVDLLVDTSADAHSPASYEIWDYKGSSFHNLNLQGLKNYEFQMRVYAYLYRIKHGVLPQRVILYFLNELDGETCPTTRPVNAIFEVSIDPTDIDVAIQEFTTTVGDIEQARQTDTWLPASPGHISEADCTICDLRWDCPTPNNGSGVKMRYP